MYYLLMREKFIILFCCWWKMMNIQGLNKNTFSLILINRKYRKSVQTCSTRRNLCVSTATYYAANIAHKAIRARPAPTTRSAIPAPAPWLFLLPITPNRHRHPPVSISATFKSRDTMFRGQLCIRVDCAPGVNMLQLLANRTSERGVWKGKEGVLRSSTLTHNVTLPLPRSMIAFPLDPPCHFFLPPLSFSFFLFSGEERREREKESRRNEISRAGWAAPRGTQPPLSYSVHDNLVIQHYRVATLSLYFSINPQRGVERSARPMKFEENRSVASKLRF